MGCRAVPWREARTARPWARLPEWQLRPCNELVRRARLAAADALDLGRVQRVDLWPALTLLLMSNPQREIEQRAKAVFERCVALDLAANVTDDAAKPRAQKLQFPPRAVELVGMHVAPHHDGGTLGEAQIALAQLNALALGQLHQLLDRAMGEPGVGRMRDRLSCTVVSIATRSRSLVSIAAVRWATERLSCNSA